MIASFMKIGSLLTALALPFTQKTVLNRPEKMEITAATTNFHSFKMKGIDGKEIDFSQFKGKKIIVLNTASKCGYTPQYADWEKFHKENKDIVILGFPANEFGGQEPGSAEDIANFCEKNYGVTFTITEKIDVKGNNQHPLYAWLTQKKLNGVKDSEVKWNFQKYLVSENGELLEVYSSSVKPMSKELISAL